MQVLLGALLDQLRPDLRVLGGVRLAQDVCNTLVGRGEALSLFEFEERLDGFEPEFEVDE